MSKQRFTLSVLLVVSLLALILAPPVAPQPEVRPTLLTGQRTAEEWAAGEFEHTGHTQAANFDANGNRDTEDPPRTIDAFRRPRLQPSTAIWATGRPSQCWSWMATRPKPCWGKRPTQAIPALSCVRSGQAMISMFAVHVHDDAIVSDSGDVWDDDQVELAIDGLRDLLSGGLDDHQFTVNADGRVTDRGAANPPIEAAARPVTGGWDVEVRIPAVMLYIGALGFAILASAWACTTTTTAAPGTAT